MVALKRNLSVILEKTGGFYITFMTIGFNLNSLFPYFSKRSRGYFNFRKICHLQPGSFFFLWVLLRASYGLKKRRIFPPWKVGSPSGKGTPPIVHIVSRWWIVSQRRKWQRFSLCFLQRFVPILFWFSFFRTFSTFSWNWNFLHFVFFFLFARNSQWFDLV